MNPLNAGGIYYLRASIWIAATFKSKMGLQQSMPLDPQVKKLFSLMAVFPQPDIGKITPQQYREAADKASIQLSGEPEAIGGIEDKTIQGRNGGIRIRIYRPLNQRPPHKVVIYYHGGGFVFGSIETHDNVNRLLANLSGRAVVSVNYRLAPENKFPAAVEDAFDAAKWVVSNGESIGLDSNKVVVAGDSAGGNLATVVNIMARDAGENFIERQVLFYPSTHMLDNSPSIHEYGEGFFLTMDQMRWFGQQYLRDVRDAVNPYASPMLADLSGLSPALVVTAEYDPLRDQGEIYAHRLRASGVKATLTRFGGVIHGFISFYRYIYAGRDAIAMAAGFIKQ